MLLAMSRRILIDVTETQSYQNKSNSGHGCFDLFELFRSEKSNNNQISRNSTIFVKINLILILKNYV